MEHQSITHRLWLHFDLVLLIIGLAIGAAGGVFFLHQLDSQVQFIDDRVRDMQEFDEGWMHQDQDETAGLVSLLDELRIGQGTILGRLDGTGGDLLYRMGYRDGITTCSK